MEKRKEGKSSVEIGADAGFEEMKKEDIAHESESATSSTLSEKRKNEMGELVKKMATLRSIYNAGVIVLGGIERACLKRRSG